MIIIKIVLYGIILCIDTFNVLDIIFIKTNILNHKQRTETIHIDSTEAKIHTAQYSKKARIIKLKK